MCDARRLLAYSSVTGTAPSSATAKNRPVHRHRPNPRPRREVGIRHAAHRSRVHLALDRPLSTAAAAQRRVPTRCVRTQSGELEGKMAIGTTLPSLRPPSTPNCDPRTRQPAAERRGKETIQASLRDIKTEESAKAPVLSLFPVVERPSRRGHQTPISSPRTTANAASCDPTQGTSAPIAIKAAPRHRRYQIIRESNGLCCSVSTDAYCFVFPRNQPLSEAASCLPRGIRPLGRRLRGRNVAGTLRLSRRP
jgi:hypothetical protein